MTQQDVIKAFVQSLDATELKGEVAIDQALQASSNFKSVAQLRTQFLDDLKSAKNWHTFLVEKCGIILDNKDNGAISGSDTGGDTPKTAQDLLPCKGDAKKYPSDSSITVNGLTVYGIPSKNELTEEGDNRQDRQYIIQGLNSWWLSDSLERIKEDYGLSFDSSAEANSRVRLDFVEYVDDPADFRVIAINSSEDDKGESELRTLTVQRKYTGNFGIATGTSTDEDRHGKIDFFNMTTFDVSLMQELVNGLVASNVKYYDSLPVWFKDGGLSKLISGIDNEYRTDIANLMTTTAALMREDSDSTDKTTAFENILNSESLDKYQPASISIVGYVFMRYFIKQAGTDTKFDYDTYKKTVTVDDLNFAVNYHDTVTMTGGTGNDTIVNSGSNVSIKLGKGKDLVKNYSDKVKVEGGSGADRIINQGAEITILGGSGDDRINNSKYSINSSIDGGTGKDYITNTGANSTLSGGDGNDEIINNVNAINSLIDGGADNDKIENHGENSILIGGAGDDYVSNTGAKSTLIGGDGDDELSNSINAINSSIDGGDGNDKINNSAKKCTLSGGAGNDRIINAGSTVKIYGQDGNDNIYNTSKSSSIYGNAGNDTIDNEGDRCRISSGKGKDIITNDGESVKIYGDAGNDKLKNKVGGKNSSLSGGSGKDYIVNFADFSSIYGSSGNDTLYSSGEGVILNGGSNNDSIKNDGVKAQIFGGSGNDKIYNYGNHITISGGTGNDYIQNTGKDVLFQYSLGDGNDTIVGLSAKSTLSIGDGTESYSTVKSGKDIIVTVGDGKITLSGAANLDTINILGKKDSSILTLTDSSSANVTLNSEEKIGDATARTKAIKIMGNALDNSILGGTGKDTLYGADGDDYLVGNDGNDKIYGQNGNDTLWGGIGNDTLKGGDGADVFIYKPNEGKDVITDFSNNDMLQIVDSTFSKAVYKSNTLTLTVDGGGSIIFKNVNTATEFNINGTNYKVSGSTIK